MRYVNINRRTGERFVMAPSAAKRGRILAAQRLNSGTDQAFEGADSWYALRTRRQDEVAAHLGTLGYEVDTRVKGYVLFKARDIERENHWIIAGTPGAGKVLTKTAAGDGAGKLVREHAEIDDVANICKKAAPAAPVVSKLSPRQKAKRRMKDKRRAKQPKEGT